MFCRMSCATCSTGGPACVYGQSLDFAPDGHDCLIGPLLTKLARLSSRGNLRPAGSLCVPVPQPPTPVLGHKIAPPGSS